MNAENEAPKLPPRRLLGQSSAYRTPRSRRSAARREVKRPAHRSQWRQSASAYGTNESHIGKVSRPKSSASCHSDARARGPKGIRTFEQRRPTRNSPAGQETPATSQGSHHQKFRVLYIIPVIGHSLDFWPIPVLPRGLHKSWARRFLGFAPGPKILMLSSSFAPRRLAYSSSKQHFTPCDESLSLKRCTGLTTNAVGQVLPFFSAPSAVLLCVLSVLRFLLPLPFRDSNCYISPTSTDSV